MVELRCFINNLSIKTKQPETMNTEENKQLMRDYIENVINAKDVSRIAEYISDNYIEVHGKLLEKVGFEEAKKRVLGMYNTFPDFHIRVDRQIAEGEWVATCCTITGTHAGIWLNMKPTGKRLEYTLVAIDRIVDGKIVEHGGAANNFEAFLTAGGIRLVELDEDK